MKNRVSSGKKIKKIKIKNKFRFVTFCTIVMLIIFVVCSSLFGFSDVQSNNNREYVNVMIQPGDTLWKLARKYGPDDVDVRYVIHEIRNINGVDPGCLRIGTYIQIPTSL